MRTKILPVMLAFLLALTAGCGGDSNGSTTTTTPTPTTTSTPQASQASVTVQVLGFGALGSDQGNLFAIRLRLTESAGVGVNINFIRLEVFRATGEFEERQEIGAGQITSQTGSNRLAANSTRDLDPVLFTFNATIKSGRTIRVTVGLTDDLGNNLDFTADFIFT